MTKPSWLVMIHNKRRQDDVPLVAVFVCNTYFCNESNGQNSVCST